MQRPTTRSGFTLIELLVVIAIISILVSLTMAAVQKVRERGREVQCRADITQLETAIGSFKAKFGVYPPCAGGGPNGTFRLASRYGFITNGTLTYLSGYSASSPEVMILNQMFPRIIISDNGLRMVDTSGNPIPYNLNNLGSAGIDGASPILLDPNQCLVFFLSGGIFTGYNGFSTNPGTPFQAPAANGIPASRLNNGALFDFPGSRMLLRSKFTETYFTPGNGLRFAGDAAPNPQTEQPWYTDPWGTPYLYLSTTQGNDYPFATPATAMKIGPWGGIYSPNTAGVSPFYTGPVTNPTFLNNRSTQIISAGRDKKFGNGGQRDPANPNANPIYGRTMPGGDDFSNFQQLSLSVPQS